MSVYLFLDDNVKFLSDSGWNAPYTRHAYTEPVREDGRFSRSLPLSIIYCELALECGREMRAVLHCSKYFARFFPPVPPHSTPLSGPRKASDYIYLFIFIHFFIAIIVSPDFNNIVARSEEPSLSFMQVYLLWRM